MSDDLNQAQEIPAAKVKKTPPIPTREATTREIRRLWILCISMASIIFLASGMTMWSLFQTDRDPKSVVAITTGAFQVLVLSYGMGFFVPAFLTSLRRLALGIEMNRQGLEIAEKTAAVLDKIDNVIDQRVVRLDALFDKFEKMGTAMDDGKHPLLDRAEKYISKELDKLRLEVRKQRSDVEEELDTALAEGEAKAAELDGDPCSLCGQLHDGPCMGIPCAICDKQHEDGRCPDCPDCTNRTGPHTHRKAVK